MGDAIFDNSIIAEEEDVSPEAECKSDIGTIMDMITTENTPVRSIPSRDQIVRLQEAMLPIQCDPPEPGHYFAPGMYCRELTVPAGMLIVGKIHRHAHFLMVLKGRAEVVSEFGREIVEAGHISVSPAGVKRVVLAIEDTKFVTVHVNKSDTEDLEIIEADHIEPEILGISEYMKEVLP